MIVFISLVSLETTEVILDGLTQDDLKSRRSNEQKYGSEVTPP